MALLQKLFVANRVFNILPVSSGFGHTSLGKYSTTGSSTNYTNNSDEDVDLPSSENYGDMPIDMENPFAKPKPQCILCKYDIEPNYKNVRLLSQFVSKYTGRIYGRHITGLCEHKHKRVSEEIQKARLCALMGVYTKEPNYFLDPPLYDESRPLLVHKYV